MHCVLTEKKEVSKLFNAFDLYPQMLHNMRVDNKIPLEELKGYADLVTDIESKKIRVLIRYSGTENLLRILLEGKDDKELEECMEKAIKFFKSRLNE